ncbi:MAG: hypothetical protein Q4D95_02065 [Peptoniphilus sp.]|nr:hypothetical protein [Peptoniphilus sp.]
MKDLKKYLYMHYTSSQRGLYVITMIFIVLSFFHFVNANFKFGDNPQLFMVIYHVSLILAISTLKLLDADKRFLLSLPLNNFKIYPWSILLFEFMVLGFYLVLFLPFYLLTGTSPGYFLLMETNLLLLGALLNLLATYYRNLKKLIFSLYWLFPLFLLIIGFSAYAGPFTDSFTRFNLIMMAVFLLLFTILALGFKDHVLKEKVKNKDRESKKIKDAETSKFGAYLRLKLWTALETKSHRLLILILLIMVLIDRMSNKTLGTAIFNAVPFVVILLLIYPPENILAALPYDLHKIYIRDRIFNFLLFLIFNAIYFSIAYFLKIKTADVLLSLFLRNAFLFSIASLFSFNNSFNIAMVTALYFRYNFFEIFMNLSLRGYLIATIIFLLMYSIGPAIIFNFFKDRYAMRANQSPKKSL